MRRSPTFLIRDVYITPGGTLLLLLLENREYVIEHVYIVLACSHMQYIDTVSLGSEHLCTVFDQHFNDSHVLLSGSPQKRGPSLLHIRSHIKIPTSLDASSKMSLKYARSLMALKASILPLYAM